MRKIPVDIHFAYDNLKYAQFQYRGKIITRMRVFGPQDYTLYGIVFEDGTVKAVMNAKVHMMIDVSDLEKDLNHLGCVNKDLKINFDEYQERLTLYQSSYGSGDGRLKTRSEHQIAISNLQKDYNTKNRAILEKHCMTREYYKFLSQIFHMLDKK